jgi:hypothetical protein
VAVRRGKIKGKAKGKRQKAKGKSNTPATHTLENAGAEGVRFDFIFAFCLLPFAFCLAPF